MTEVTMHRVRGKVTFLEPETAHLSGDVAAELTEALAAGNAVDYAAAFVLHVAARFPAAAPPAWDSLSVTMEASARSSGEDVVLVRDGSAGSLDFISFAADGSNKLLILDDGDDWETVLAEVLIFEIEWSAPD